MSAAFNAPIAGAIFALEVVLGKLTVSYFSAVVISAVSAAIIGRIFLGDLPANWFFGIEPNAFGVVGAAVNFAVTFTVTRFTAPPPQTVQRLIDDIRVPAAIPRD